VKAFFRLQAFGFEAPEACNLIFKIARIAGHGSMVAAEGTMRPKKPEATGEGDLFRARLDQIINMKHELVPAWRQDRLRLD
jgi:hypothetical protein